MPGAASDRTVWTLGLAAVPVWCAVFLWTPLNFWVVMALGTGGLAAASWMAAPDAMGRAMAFRRSDLVSGLLSAVFLYLVFLGGREVAVRVLPFAGEQILSVYDNRGLLELWQIGLFIALVIGPAEEVFWRGFLQRELAARVGARKGYLFAVAAYAGVHIVTRNAMLVVAAGTAGLLWAWLYMRTGRLWPGIVSHVVWDLTVFLFVPLA